MCLRMKSQVGGFIFRDLLLNEADSQDNSAPFSENDVVHFNWHWIFHSNVFISQLLHRIVPRHSKQ